MEILAWPATWMPMVHSDSSHVAVDVNLHACDDDVSYKSWLHGGCVAAVPFKGKAVDWYNLNMTTWARITGSCYTGCKHLQAFDLSKWVAGWHCHGTAV
jgi:hypothetical protein